MNKRGLVYDVRRSVVAGATFGIVRFKNVQKFVCFVLWFTYHNNKHPFLQRHKQEEDRKVCMMCWVHALPDSLSMAMLIQPISLMFRIQAAAGFLSSKTYRDANRSINHIHKIFWKKSVNGCKTQFQTPPVIGWMGLSFKAIGLFVCT